MLEDDLNIICINFETKLFEQLPLVIQNINAFSMECFIHFDELVSRINLDRL